MRIAGVRLDDRRAVWVDAGDLRPEPWQRVVVALDEGEVGGAVFMCPEQLLQSPETVAGTLVRLEHEKEAVKTTGPIPGADLPPLGTCVRSSLGPGTVIAIDAVTRTITLALRSGEQGQVRAEDIR